MQRSTPLAALAAARLALAPVAGNAQPWLSKPISYVWAELVKKSGATPN